MNNMLRANDCPPSNPEVWGGLECTINRTSTGWHDQLAVAGHYSRHSDIGQLAELGIKALRYPVLWERHQPHRQSNIDWSWTAGQLKAIRDHSIIPITGLLHHGSGPCFTDLLSAGFADDFARYAGCVAAQFPWLEYYTPVNEPLTTARFSGLYGLWYPHHTDTLSFIRMLLQQLKGTVKAMKAIRCVNPAAKLIQTEDLAKSYSTPSLSYQVDFENHRRWLTYDILSGRLNRMHPLWDYLLFIGIREAELAFFTDNPCQPDILGVNYYITSERFLDEDLGKYDLAKHGGNGRDIYVDTEVVRVLSTTGLSPLLKETWDRYQIPIAITEAHLNCTREEQIRWLKEIWDSACMARQSGIDLTAVTAWALLGASDWDSLLTRTDGHYEPGAFEIRDGKPQITAVGHIIRALATTGNIEHPLLDKAGWWHRLHQPGQDSCTTSGMLLIIGKSGPLTVKLTDACINRGITFDRQLVPGDSFLKEGEPMPWGVISLHTSDRERSVLACDCALNGIHYQELTGDQDINIFLNLFVDQAMALYMVEYEMPENNFTDLRVIAHPHR